MSQELYRHYDRELMAFRDLAEWFAGKYENASRLSFNSQNDPHVGRLIESFALLTARIQHKLEDDFPQLTDALLGVLYPHYLAPIPSMAIVQFELDAASTKLDGVRIPRESELETQRIAGVECFFRTGYDVTLWPLQVTDAELQTPAPLSLQPPRGTEAVLRLQLKSLGESTFENLQIDRLRFFLNCESHHLVLAMYELLFNHAIRVAFRSLTADRKPLLQIGPEQCLTPVGFEPDEALLPYPDHAFGGYRLLTEFFTFPKKFQFVDVGGWSQLRQPGIGREVEVLIYLDQDQLDVSDAIKKKILSFRLGCTPVVNLSQREVEAKEVTHAGYEYLIVPDRDHPQGMEVHSVKEVVNRPDAGVETKYQPFYSFRHGGSHRDRATFWYTRRHPSQRPGDQGSDVYLSLVDLAFNPRLPAEGKLHVTVTRTNGDLPTQPTELAFELSNAVAHVHRPLCLGKPSPALHPPVGNGAHWRLISHLCLNHLTLSGSQEGRQALQEILRLYDFAEPGSPLANVANQLIESIGAVNCQRVARRIDSDDPAARGVYRGLEVTITFGGQDNVGRSSFLFACVLERFLGLYASVNSFTQLVGKTQQGEVFFKNRPPRAGNFPLL